MYNKCRFKGHYEKGNLKKKSMLQILCFFFPQLLHLKDVPNNNIFINDILFNRKCITHENLEL